MVEPSAYKPSARSRPDPERIETGRRQPAEAAVHELPHQRPPRPDARVLTAEIDRLQAELADMRARLADLEARAERDPLTGILNRRGFERELIRASAYLDRYPASAALVYFDLDGFKPVNDRHGHAAGDALLVGVATMLTQHVRASDSVARLGGDEFAVLLWNLGEAEALAKADALEAQIAALAVPFEDTSVSVGASSGVALLAAGRRPAEVVARADAAMYARKAARLCASGSSEGPFRR